jgi:hypothetical protein
VVYVGGNFTISNWAPRLGVAAFDASGQPTSTVINAAGVDTLQLFVPSTASKTLDLAGTFAVVNGSVSQSFGAAPVP